MKISCHFLSVFPMGKLEAECLSSKPKVNHTMKNQTFSLWTVWQQDCKPTGATQTIAMVPLFCLLLALAIFTASKGSAQSNTNCVHCPSGLIAWWPSDGSGTNLAGSGNGNVEDGATYTSGKVGQAFNLAGPSDYVWVPSSPTLHSDRQLTILGWFRADALSPEWQTLVWKGNTPDCTTQCENREFGIWLHQAGNLYLCSTPVDRIGVGNLSVNTPPGQITAGEWYHFAAVINCDENRMSLFLNGTTATTTNYSTAGIRTSDGALHIGVTGGGAHPFGGLIDEVAIFNRALSSIEIAAIYAAGTNGVCKDALPPTILTWPTNQYVAVGSQVTLSVTASGTEPLTYQWQRFGTNIAGATLSAFTTQSIALSDAGPYSVLVSNARGTATSPAAVLTVVPPPLIAVQPRSQVWPVGAPTVYFSVFATSMTPIAFQWLKDGTNLPGETNYYYSIPALQTNQIGTYAVRVANLGGSVLSSNAILTLPMTAPTNCAAQPAGAVSWWPADGFSFDLTSTNHGFLEGASYAPGFVGAAFTFDGADDYVWVPNSPSLQPDRELTLCGWFMPSPLSQEWATLIHKGNGLDGSQAMVSDRAYAVFLNNQGLLNFSSTPVDRVGVGHSYVSTPNGVISAGQWHHFAAVANCNLGHLRIYLNGTLMAEAPYSTNGIRSSSNPLILGTVYGKGSWFPGLMDEVTLYNRALSGDEIAAISGSGNAGVCYTNYPMPVFVVQPASQTALVLGSATMTGAAMGVPRPAYQWLFNGAPLAGATNPVLNLENLNTNHSGGYVLVASNVFGVRTSGVGHLEVVLPRFMSGVEDFESGWNGWYPDSGVWEVGVPTSGPWGAHSGTNVAGTVLGGNYPAQTDSRLISPAFVLPALTGAERLELRFWHWFEYNGHPANIDKGYVQISVWNGSAWGDWTTLATPVDSHTAESIHFPTYDSGWSKCAVELTAYAGQTVRVAFYHVAAQGINFSGSGSGWYLDDVQVWKGVPQMAVLESFESGWGDWYAENGVWQILAISGARSGTNTATTGAYPAQTDSRLISPAFVLPALTGVERLELRFWHWFDTTGTLAILTRGMCRFRFGMAVPGVAGPRWPHRWTHILRRAFTFRPIIAGGASVRWN